MYQQSTAQTTRAQWYVAYCQPMKEQRVSAALGSRAIDHYLPLVSRKIAGKQKYLPLFPRYLFVYVNLNMVAIQRINTTPGLIRLIAFGDTPQPLPTQTITALQQQVDSINAQGGLLTHTFQPGDSVLLKSGPLRGLNAVFTGPMRPTERVHVLLDFLGRLNDVEVNIQQLERAEPAAPSQRERRTRGKGRVISQTR